jgi:hypothetical protein
LIQINDARVAAIDVAHKPGDRIGLLRLCPTPQVDWRKRRAAQGGAMTGNEAERLAHLLEDFNAKRHLLDELMVIHSADLTLMSWRGMPRRFEMPRKP